MKNVPQVGAFNDADVMRADEIELTKAAAQPR
jgi:hypothetical protein